MVPNAHGAKSSDEGLTKDAIPIADQVARRLFPRESVDDLAWETSSSSATAAGVLRHVFGDRRLRHGEAELQRLTVDPWRAPERFCDAYLPDRGSKLLIDFRAPAAGT
jgi:hypothetical protein